MVVLIGSPPMHGGCSFALAPPLDRSLCSNGHGSQSKQPSDLTPWCLDSFFAAQLAAPSLRSGGTGRPAPDTEVGQGLLPLPARHGVCAGGAYIIVLGLGLWYG